MKSYLKGLLTGLAASVIICAASATAENIDAIFNYLRINVNGIDQVQWGEEITLDDGTSAPSSILYNGTTYLSIRQIGELLDMDVHWNGDSRTVSITEEKENTRTLAQKPDKNGNIWKYYTFTSDDGYYLGVKDEARGYERIYRLASPSVRVTDNEIYFLSSPISAYVSPVTRLSFDNDIDSQDGENIAEISWMWNGRAKYSVFDGDYIFYCDSFGGTHTYPAVQVLNYITGERNSYNTWSSYDNPDTITILESDENSATIKFKYTDHHTDTDGNPLATFSTTLKYDKINNTFVEL